MTATLGRVGRPRGGRGAKRTSADLEALSDKFASFVKANPGLRIEQINKQLGTTTKDLALPIRKLVADGEIKTKGAKRSTQYFAGKSKKD
jgi:predicted transcriptional regulator